MPVPPGRLAVLVLLSAALAEAFGQPVPVPPEKAAAPTPAQLLLDRSTQLNADGMRCCQRGDFDGARVRWQEALAIRRKAYPREHYAHGHADLAQSINNLGFLYHSTGDYARAEPLYREALAMKRALYPAERFPHGHPDLAKSINNLAGLHHARGERARAEPLLAEALAMQRALYSRERFPDGHPELARSLHNLGSTYQMVGDYAKAVPLLREALAMMRTLYPKERFPEGHPQLAASLDQLAFLYQAAGGYALAEPLLREALAITRALYPAERFPDGHPQLANNLNSLGSHHLAAGDYAKAEPLFREALAMRRALYPAERFPHGHPALAMSLNNLGSLYWNAGDHGRAERFYREALAMARALYPAERYPHGHPDLAASLSNLGFLLLAAGDHGRAQPVFLEALAMSGRQVRQHADLAAEAESRLFAATLPRSRDGLLSASRHLAADAAAYEALWDGRALLTRLQERRHRDLLASADPATAALADELQAPRRRLARLLLSSGRAADAHRQQVEQLTRAREDLEKRIAAKLRLGDLTPATAVTTVKQLQGALPAGAAFVDLIQYVHFEHDPKRPGKKGQKRTPCYVAFVLARGRPVARAELGEAAPIAAACAAWHKALLAPGGKAQSERAAAEAFAKRVWEPIRAVLPADCRTVYVTPDGAVAQVPWAALPGHKADTVLLEEHAVCLVPHGAWLLERLTTSASRGGRQPSEDLLLAYGGIDYDGPPAVGKSRRPEAGELPGGAAAPGGAEKRLTWAALPGTAREQAQIVALARQALKDPPLVRSGRAASAAQLLEDLPRARYAHLATHGFFADPKLRSYLQVDAALYEQDTLGERHSVGSRSPLVLSGLVLAGANRRGKEAAADQGLVTAEALLGLPLEGLELAVLSACDTGLGEVAGGEGVFGLQRAFHIAGCKNVVASLWQVDDEATAALMGLFYHQLWVENKAPAEALRQAQLTLYRHPERIGVLARQRGPDFDKAARLPATSGAASARRSPARLWAGFVLSGLGR